MIVVWFFKERNVCLLFYTQIFSIVISYRRLGRLNSLYYAYYLWFDRYLSWLNPILLFKLFFFFTNKIEKNILFGQINFSMCLLSYINTLQDKRRLASASDDGTVKIWEFVCPWPAGHNAIDDTSKKYMLLY